MLSVGGVSATAASAGSQAAISTLLDELLTASPSIASYDRASFTHWIDADGDGCDTRNEVLILESQTAVTLGAGCSISNGSWLSYYDGATWTNPSDVDVDHMVPLGEAWKSGASAWTSSQRQAFANDLGLDVSLEAVTDNVNSSKGDRDPGAWLPPLSNVHCQYATNWVLVKYRWNLAVDSNERAALQSIIAGTCASTIVTVPEKAGTPTVPASVERLWGVDRYATAIAIAGQYAAGVDALYVATGTNYPDALSAAPAAAAQGSPLLLTDPSSLPLSVEQEIRRLAPALIVVVGGPGAISSTVYDKLATLAPAIRRDSGVDRYQTSYAINQAAFPSGASTAFIATGSNFPDALSASAAAGSMGAPVILVNGAAASVDTATRNLITELGVTNVKIAGGISVVSAGMETSLSGITGVTSVVRHSGIDRYTTSSAISRASFISAPTVYFAVGTGFADALAGAALAGLNNSPLYVVPTNCVPSYVLTDLQALGTRQRVLLGGSSVLGAGVEALTPCDSSTPPPPPPPPVSPANPGDTKNCGDFGTWQEAQAWFNTYYPYYGDVARLDFDNDLIACQSLPGHP
ncbi:hypothetical protein GCM10007382_26470 [Salinibacterium xinjiangense]|uniref:Excalibur calcium-binding domain-containing protein n=1 Tax=Salinibacterium xinjiangense TaxID=386302 RepID=A0A2C8ZVB5_9MICO|nr:hypothetical protein GCM10007382_26470 [Salinibacterium xinjiangense]SOE69804.1 Excalibur calcium-binding domain-containing protein [Salinibacterium xinjiangense]